MRVEHSRKHGPFDKRYRPTRHKPVPTKLWRLGEERLDWQEFLARFFPDRRRHDRDALAAYESYVNDVESRSALSATASRPTAAPASLPDRLSEDEEEPTATADTDRWQGEGGASAGRSRRPRRGERPVGTQRL